jgi:hypothetical protein
MPPQRPALADSRALVHAEAQEGVIYLEPAIEPLFHEDSYGYRPLKSAHDASRSGVAIDKEEIEQRADEMEKEDANGPEPFLTADRVHQQPDREPRVEQCDNEANGVVRIDKVGKKRSHELGKLAAEVNRLVHMGNETSSPIAENTNPRTQ